MSEVDYDSPEVARGRQQVPGHGTPVGIQTNPKATDTVASPASSNSEAPDAVEESEESTDEPDATVTAEELAEELYVDLSEVQGSGQDGRITADDVRAAADDTSAE